MLNYVHPDKNFSSKIAYRVSFERYQPLLSFYHLFSQFWIAFMRIFSTIFMTQKFHYTILLHKTHIGLEAQLNINQMTWFLNCDHFIYKSSQKSPGSQYLKTSCILNHPIVVLTSHFIMYPKSLTLWKNKLRPVLNIILSSPQQINMNMTCGLKKQLTWIWSWEKSAQNMRVTYTHAWQTPTFFFKTESILKK